jgi:hypothetical protein
LAGDLGTTAWAAAGKRTRATAAVAVAALVAVAAGILRPRFANRDGFADRRAEVSIGAACRQRAASTDRLVIDTPDYGFFAIIVGFRHPERAAPLDDRDPRHARQPDPFTDATTLAQRLEQADASWLVASQVARREVERDDLLLLRVPVR